jgi:hypothetical protein
VDQLSVGRICIFVSGFETLVMLAVGAMSFVIELLSGAIY